MEDILLMLSNNVYVNEWSEKVDMFTSCVTIYNINKIFYLLYFVHCLEMIETSIS